LQRFFIYRQSAAENLGDFMRILSYNTVKYICKKKHIFPPQAATSTVFALLRHGKQVQWSAFTSKASGAW